jgi:hypothetical protein
MAESNARQTASEEPSIMRRTGSFVETAEPLEVHAPAQETGGRWMPNLTMRFVAGMTSGAVIASVAIFSAQAVQSHRQAASPASPVSPASQESPAKVVFVSPNDEERGSLQSKASEDELASMIRRYTDHGHSVLSRTVMVRPSWIFPESDVDGSPGVLVSETSCTVFNVRTHYSALAAVRGPTSFAASLSEPIMRAAALVNLDTHCRIAPFLTALQRGVEDGKSSEASPTGIASPNSSVETLWMDILRKEGVERVGAYVADAMSILVIAQEHGAESAIAAAQTVRDQWGTSPDALDPEARVRTSRMMIDRMIDRLKKDPKGFVPSSKAQAFERAVKIGVAEAKLLLEFSWEDLQKPDTPASLRIPNDFSRQFLKRLDKAERSILASYLGNDHASTTVKAVTIVRPFEANEPSVSQPGSEASGESGRPGPSADKRSYMKNVADEMTAPNRSQIELEGIENRLRSFIDGLRAGVKTEEGAKPPRRLI